MVVEHDKIQRWAENVEDSIRNFDDLNKAREEGMNDQTYNEHFEAYLKRLDEVSVLRTKHEKKFRKYEEALNAFKDMDRGLRDLNRNLEYLQKIKDKNKARLPFENPAVAQESLDVFKTYHNSLKKFKDFWNIQGNEARRKLGFTEDDMKQLYDEIKNIGLNIKQLEIVKVNVTPRPPYRNPVPGKKKCKGPLCKGNIAEKRNPYYKKTKKKGKEEKFSKLMNTYGRMYKY